MELELSINYFSNQRDSHDKVGVISSASAREFTRHGTLLCINASAEHPTHICFAIEHRWEHVGGFVGLQQEGPLLCLYQKVVQAQRCFKG